MHGRRRMTITREKRCRRSDAGALDRLGGGLRATCLTGLLALTACAAEPEPAPPPDVPSPADAAVEPTRSPGDVDPADTSTGPIGPPSDPGSDDWTVGDTRVERDVPGVAVLRSVRTARHDGYDRIVLDFGDDPMPGYRIAYVDRPVRQCGSGNTVPVAGDGWLRIEMVPAHAHTEQGEATVVDRDRMPGLPNLRQLVLTCDFEGHVEWVAGVGSPTSYRVTELASPARLVIDVRHAGGS